MKFKALGTVAAVALFVASSAHANLVDGRVDIWQLHVETFFAPGSAVFTPGTGVSSVTASSLRWGTALLPGNPSGIDIIGSPITRFPTTNGPVVETISVSHLNRPLAAGSTILDSVNIVASVTLTPFAPPGPGLPTIPIPFFVDFLETPNNPAGGICANGEPNFTGSNSTGCADLFVINENALSLPFNYDLDGAGPLPTLSYVAELFEVGTGINALSAAACTAVLGPGNTSCVGFETEEGFETTFQFGVAITGPQFVPAPGSLALSGLGLLLVGWSCRRVGIKLG